MERVLERLEERAAPIVPDESEKAAGGGEGEYGVGDRPTARPGRTGAVAA